MKAKRSAWLAELEANPDLLRLQTPDSGRSWVHHNPGRKRVDLQYFWHPIEKKLLGAAYFGPEAEGPPGCAHGGSIASVMDDAMGTAIWAAGHRVVAANLNVNFRQFVPLESSKRIECVVERVEGRKVWVRGELRSDEGDLHAESTGLFIEIDFQKLLDRQPKGPVA